MVTESDLTDEEMVTKKERDIDKRNRKLDIREAVSNGKDTSKMSNIERMFKLERNGTEQNAILDNLSSDALQLARRILRMSKEVVLLRRDLHEIKDDLTSMKKAAKDIKEETDKYEIREDKKFEIRRDTILRVLAISVPVLIVIIGIIMSIKRW